MNAQFSHNPPYLFALGFVVLWLTMGAFLGVMSGWYRLMSRYPDASDTPLLVLRRQSGKVGTVNMHSILTLGICPSGLRIGITRLFGIFCREFFVPWEEMEISRQNRFLLKVVQISFGHPAVGNLTLQADVANRVARASAGRWPETGPFPVETDNQTASRLFGLWALQTALAGAFFTVAPRLVAPKGTVLPPVTITILFPATVFAIVALIQYARRPRE
jgi:hypothetical protein